MKPHAHPATCPDCNASGARCSSCGSYYRYDAPSTCISVVCRAATASAVCRCGRKHTVRVVVAPD